MRAADLTTFVQPSSSASPIRSPPGCGGPIHVFVLDYLADELGAELAKPGERLVEVVHEGRRYPSAEATCTSFRRCGTRTSGSCERCVGAASSRTSCWPGVSPPSSSSNQWPTSPPSTTGPSSVSTTTI